MKHQNVQHTIMEIIFSDSSILGTKPQNNSVINGDVKQIPTMRHADKI